MAVRKSQIRSLVEDILDKNSISNAPVPVEKIAKSYGIEIKRERVDDDLSGFLVREKKENRVIIGANKAHHPNRQRFTIAHELGHFLLHEGETIHLDGARGSFTLNLRDSESSTGEDDGEREANFFAAELLMPAKLLQKDLQEKSLDLLSDDDELLSKLATKYGVSVQALTFRLANLNYIQL